jgi:FixJ family two-component response regulator
MAAVRQAPIVCVVDDDPSVRRALTVLLRCHGFRVEAYAGAEQLLRQAQAGRSRFAVLVLDIHLGTATGFEAYEGLRAMGLAIPTIFMTGRDDASTRQRAWRAGAKAYLVKPFDDVLFIGAIRLALTGQ